MPTIRSLSRSARPSPFSNHVLVERVEGGFRLSGASNLNYYITHLSTPVVKDRDAALREAMAWAIEHAIPEIFVMEGGCADQS